jgi:hypothetical protein
MAKSRRLRWSGHVARVDEKKNEYMILIEKEIGKRQLRRRRRR